MHRGACDLRRAPLSVAQAAEIAGGSCAPTWIIRVGVWGRVFCSASVLEAPAFVAGFDDVAVMGEAIQHGCGYLGVAKDLRPICEGEVGGNQQRGVIVELADQVEQELAIGLAERQVAEFVNVGSKPGRRGGVKTSHWIVT